MLAHILMDVNQLLGSTLKLSSSFSTVCLHMRVLYCLCCSVSSNACLSATNINLFFTISFPSPIWLHCSPISRTSLKYYAFSFFLKTLGLHGNITTLFGKSSVSKISEFQLQCYAAGHFVVWFKLPAILEDFNGFLQ